MVQNDYDEGFLLLGERHDIAKCLVASVQKKYAERIQFFFGHNCHVLSCVLYGTV